MVIPAAARYCTQAQCAGQVRRLAVAAWIHTWVRDLSGQSRGNS
jgi:hypothetical protein